MQRQDKYDLLEDENKKIGEARGILSVFWRQILKIREIDGNAWERLMQRYLLDPRNGIPNNSRDQSSERGNLTKALNGDDMTWKVFLRAMNFLDPKRVTFTISLTFKDGTTNNISARLRDRGLTLKVDNTIDGDDDEDSLSSAPDQRIEALESSEDRPSLRRKPAPQPQPSQPPSLVDAMRRSFGSFRKG